MAVLQQEGQGSRSCSVHNTSWLTSPNLTLESLRTPRKLWVFSLPWGAKEMVLVLLKECHSSEIAGRASESEDKAKIEVSIFGGLLCGLLPESVTKI